MHAFSCLPPFFQNQLFKKLFQEYLLQFGSRSSPTYCRAWSGSKLFAKVISQPRKSPPVGRDNLPVKWKKCNILYQQMTFSSVFLAGTVVWELYRGSYMSSHVLLNLLNELWKRDKMQGLMSILSLIRNNFNKFNNTRARMLDSIYHMTLRLLWNLTFGLKRYNFVII